MAARSRPHPPYLETFGTRLPAALLQECDTLVKRLGGAAADLTVGTDTSRTARTGTTGPEPVLLTGPADDRSGGYARPWVALLICPVSPRASSWRDCRHTGDVARCAQAAQRVSRMTCSAHRPGGPGTFASIWCAHWRV